MSDLRGGRGGPLSAGPSPTRGEGGTAKLRDPRRERWQVPEALRRRMVEVARGFRKEPTRSEGLLWEALRRRSLAGRKFRRQQPFGPFVVDFFCPSERLIVEVDGGVHESQREHDAARQECLEALGLRFLRIPAVQVEFDLPTVLHTIRLSFLGNVVAVAVRSSPLVGEGPGERGTSQRERMPSNGPGPTPFIPEVAR